MSILVVGASKGVAKEVVSQLLAHTPRPSIRVASRDPSKVSFPDGVSVINADINDPSCYSYLFKGVSKVFLYCHGQAPTIASAAKDAGVQHIVVLSSAAVAFSPENFVGKLHSQFEEGIKASGITYTFLRPGKFTSNAKNFWGGTIKRMGKVIISHPDSKTAPIADEDIAAVGVIALTTDKVNNAAPILTGPEGITQRQEVAILDKISREGGEKGVQLQEVSGQEWKAMVSAFVPSPIADAMLDFMETATKTNVGKFVSPEVEKITGNPPMTYEAWVRKHKGEIF